MFGKSVAALILVLAGASAVTAEPAKPPKPAEPAKPDPKAAPAKATKPRAKAAAKTAKVAKAKKPAGRPHATSRFDAPADAETTPAVRYGALDQVACEAELDARQISYAPESAPGVAEPVRLTQPLHGVTFRTDEPESKRATTPYEISDCRLVLALDDFAAVLEKHDVVEVRHYSMYRSPGNAWPEGKAAAQHAGGLAIDAGRFLRKDGTTLAVDSVFHGAIDAKTCGEGAGPKPATPDALELREILCDTVAQHLFNVVLTPNFNKPHHNHFHLEVTAGVKWFLVH